MLLSTRIVEGEKIAIQAPSREFGEKVKADPRLTREYVDLSKEVTGFFSSVLSDTPIVLTDNVTEFLYSAEAMKTNEKLDLGDVPVVTPPFKAVFLETKAPEHFEIQEIPAWGAFFSRLDAVDEVEYGGIAAEAVRWVVEMALLFEKGSVIRAYPAVWTFFLGGGGELLRDGKGAIIYETSTLADAELEGVVEGNQHWEALKESLFSLVVPFFWSLGFMNCKNVTLEPPPVSRQVRRQAERRGLPILDYRVLNIEPMTRVLRDEGDLASVGSRQALHICRGHFKDYRDGPGLFGKHKSVYWWEGSVRGSLAKGRLDKDYEVRRPTE